MARMARLVTVSITYDMDNTEKSLTDELNDWLQGNVNILDLFGALAGENKTAVTSPEGNTIYINEE